ncbi:MAG: tetratricopeptide repeat protein [Thermoanaerobaculia bacterium]
MAEIEIPAEIERELSQVDPQQFLAFRDQLLKTFLGGHDTLLAALGLGDEDVLGLALYARQLAQEGRLDSAKALLVSLASLDKGNAYVHLCLGSVLMQLGEAEPAIEALEKALSLDPDDIAAHTHLGELYLEQGDLEQAGIHIHRAVELDPQGTNPFAARARALAATVVSFAREVERHGPEFLEQARERIARVKALGAAASS